MQQQRKKVSEVQHRSCTQREHTHSNAHLRSRLSGQFGKELFVRIQMWQRLRCLLQSNTPHHRGGRVPARRGKVKAVVGGMQAQLKRQQNKDPYKKKDAPADTLSKQQYCKRVGQDGLT
jgi:hypothetical protein